MGPDGADGLFAFLQGRLKDWQANLTTYKAMSGTGNYPGADVVDEGHTLTNKLLADTDSTKFIERFILLKDDLVKFVDRYHDVQHFYEHQRPIWERLRKASALFQLNRFELERDATAAPAMARMREILARPSPYGLLKDVEGLIGTVSSVNAALLAGRRKDATQKIDAHYGALTKDLASVNSDPALRLACLRPLEALKQRVEQEESVAHITQAESEAVREFDVAMSRIEAFSKKQSEAPPLGTPIPAAQPTAVVKKQRVIKPAELMKATYLETADDVKTFLDALRIELDRALTNNERIQIR